MADVTEIEIGTYPASGGEVPTDRAITVGCTVLDAENFVWRVVSIDEPVTVTTRYGDITSQTCVVTNGALTETKLLCELARAALMPVGAVLARGYI